MVRFRRTNLSPLFQQPNEDSPQVSAVTRHLEELEEARLHELRKANIELQRRIQALRELIHADLPELDSTSSGSPESVSC